MPSAQPRDPHPSSNVAEFTVSELSGALKRTIEDAYGYVRVRGRDFRLQARRLGTSLLHAQGRRRGPRSTAFAGAAAPARLGPQRPRTALEVVASPVVSPLMPGVPSTRSSIDRTWSWPASRRAPGKLLDERRRRSWPPRDCSTEERKKRPALPARGHRRRHFAYRGGNQATYPASTPATVFRAMSCCGPWPCRARTPSRTKSPTAIDGFNRLPADAAPPSLGPT